MTIKALVERAQNLYGFDQEVSTLIELLNDAREDAARAAEYPRKSVELGLVEGSEDHYALPSDFLLPLHVAVAGIAWLSSDRETVRQFEAGTLELTDEGVWYEDVDDEGNRSLVLYPAIPLSTVVLEYVWRKPAFTEETQAESPTEFPNWFHPKLLFWVAVFYHKSVEDNPDLAESYQSDVDRAVSELIRYENERGSGDGVFQVAIQGWTA